MLITQEHFDNIYKTHKILHTCLVLILNDECNAQCKVCLANQTFKSSLCQKVCEKYKAKCLRCCSRNTTDNNYFKALKKILSTLQNQSVTIILTGGEPTLSSRLIPVLDLIATYSFSHLELEMETNGAKLFDPDIQEALLKYNVQIHLSRYNTRDEDNINEFNYKNYPTLETNIKDYIQIFKDNLNISTIILKKYVTSLNDIIDQVNYYRNLGINKIQYLEIMADTTLATANKDLIEYYNDQLVKIDPIIKSLKSRNYQCIEDHNTSAFRYTKFIIDGSVVSFTRSDLALQHRQPQPVGFSRFLIMPSGDIGVNGIEIR